MRSFIRTSKDLFFTPPKLQKAAAPALAADAVSARNLDAAGPRALLKAQGQAVPKVIKGPKPAKEPPYGLLVTIRLQRKDMAKFFKLANVLKNEFRTGGLELQLSGWDVSQEDPRNPAPVDRRASPGPKPRQVELFSIWFLKKNSADALRWAMSYLFDVVAYYSLDSLQLEEQKVLGLRLAEGRKVDHTVKPEDGGIDPRQTYVYVKTTNFLRTRDLAELRARFRASLKPFAKANGWFLGDAYLGLTGVPNTVTQVWLVPEGSYMRFNSQLARASWDELLESPPEYKVLQRAPFDPLFEGDE